jgi:hypothetical protein
VVERATLFNRTVEVGTNPCPVIVSRCGADPTTIVVGLSVIRPGTGFSTGSWRLAELPPGSGLETLMLRPPATRVSARNYRTKPVCTDQRRHSILTIDYDHGCRYEPTALNCQVSFPSPCKKRSRTDPSNGWYWITDRQVGPI